MNGRWFLGWMVAIAATFATSAGAAPPTTLKGTFVVGGVDAGLRYVRATRAALDQKTSGFVVLLSAKPAQGDLMTWRTAEPAKVGSFIFLMLEESGAVWVAELGHAAAKAGRFGVVTELEMRSFDVREDRLAAHVATRGEQSFSDDRYTVDLEIEAPLEK